MRVFLVYLFSCDHIACIQSAARDLQLDYTKTLENIVLSFPVRDVLSIICVRGGAGEISKTCKYSFVEHLISLLC